MGPAGGVEVVGGLVQQEDVGLQGQQAGQPRPGALTTGQAGCGVLRRQARKAHAVEGERHPRRKGPVGEVEVIAEGLAGLDPGQLRQPLAHPHQVADRQAGTVSRLLGQEPHTAGDRDRARGRMQPASEDGNKARLARPVASGHGHPAGSSGQTQVLEQPSPVRRGVAEGVEGEGRKRHGRPRSGEGRRRRRLSWGFPWRVSGVGRERECARRRGGSTRRGLVPWLPQGGFRRRRLEAGSGSRGAPLRRAERATSPWRRQWEPAAPPFPRRREG